MSAEFWLNLQSLYELRLAQQKAGKAIDRLPNLKGIGTRPRMMAFRSLYRLPKHRAGGKKTLPAFLDSLFIFRVLPNETQARSQFATHLGISGTRNMGKNRTLTYLRRFRMAATQSSKRLISASTTGGSGIPEFTAPASSWTKLEQ
jgi:hypothetical protein